MVKRGVEHKPTCQDLGESSDSAFQEEIETSKAMCQHVGKSVNLADIKRQLKANRRIGACDKKVPTPCTAASADGDESVPAGAQLPHGVWLCMQCGHQGCARHATQHFKTPRSDSHAITVDTADWAVWCFTCDEKVSLKSNKKLHEAVQFVKKKQGTLRPTATPVKEDSVTTKSSKNPSSKEKQVQDRDRESLPKVKGLINLGNSCYLNSVLQCLSQCHYLTHYLDISSRSGRKVSIADQEKTMELVLPEGGPITASLCDFLKQMHTTGTTATVSPSHLLRKIALKVPQFVGCDQQDAHELLRALMEQARIEDLRRHQRQIMLGIGLPTKTDPKQVPDDLKARVRALGRQVSHTTIDSIFSGQLVSLVVCQACMARTHRMEPFLDLSLPVAEDKPTRPKKLCGAGAEDEDGGEYLLTPNKSSGAGRPSKHAQKKERKAARRAKKHGQAAAATDGAGDELVTSNTGEKQPTSDSGQELDRQSDAASAEGESDADEEDNGDTDLVIDSLLLTSETAEDRDEPPATVSPDPPAGSTAALSEQFSALSVDPASASGAPPPPPPPPRPPGDELPALTVTGRPATSGDEPAVSAAAPRVPLVGGDARQSETNERVDPGGAGDADGVPPPDAVAAAGRQGSDALGKAQNGTAEGFGKTQLGERGLCDRQTDVVAEGMCQEGDADRIGAPENGRADGPSDRLTVDCVRTELPASEGASPPAASRQGACDPTETVGNGPVAGRDCDRTHPAQNGALAAEPAGDASPGQTLTQCEWLSRALITLAPRYQAAAGECSLLTCLNQYTAPELLAGNNKFGCDNCTELRNKRLPPPEKGEKRGTVYSNASKQLLIYSPPPVLTVHLKRFEVCSFSLRKVNRHVLFGERLDLAPFCSSISQDLPQMRSGQRRVLYSLFGVVEHSGRLTSGHYTAYVRVRRRHDKLTVNPAMLSPLVLDAFRLATERARERTERTEHTSSAETPQTAEPSETADTARSDGAEPADQLRPEMGPQPEPGSEPEPQQEPKPEPESQQKPKSESEPQQEPTPEPEPQPEAGRWFHVSDTHVTEVTLDKVLKAQAYMLFYERIV